MPVFSGYFKVVDMNINSAKNSIGVEAPSITYPKQVNTDTAVDPIARAKELLGLYHTLGQASFEHIKEVALDCHEDILCHWLPDGEMRGKQYVAYNPLRNDGELGSFTISTETGVWADFATDDKGGDLISLISYLEKGITQTNAAVKILELVAGLKTDDGAPVARRQSVPKVEYTAIMPIPESVINQRPIFFGSELGSPVATWEYHNSAGLVMCYVNRFKTASGKKEFRPQIFCKDSTGHTQWKSIAPPVPRPAYGLDRLFARPEAPVLFTEGEKAADAAQRLFPDFVAVTTMNGSQSPEKTDFTPFAGRKIFIAPDNDEAGQGYKDKLIQLLQSAGAEINGVIQLNLFAKENSQLSQGYDLADAEAEGWTADKLATLGKSLWKSLKNTESTTQSTGTVIIAQKTKLETDMDFAKHFAAQHHGGKIAHCNNQLLAYSDGYWAALHTDVDIKKPILKALGNKGTASKVNAIFELVKMEYGAKAEMFERKSPSICLNNGTLNPITGELFDHNSDDYLTNKLDITYDPQAGCPLWLQTLDEIFAPDLDKADKIKLIQEFIGYCLIPDTRMHKFLWMVGAGGNGKSLILAVLNSLVGKENISFAQIERLQDKFVRAELQGKLVNISSEMSAQATISDGYLKQIVAGDIIEAERKFQPPFSFKPYARLIAATNLLPRLLDHSEGFFRRAIVLRLNRQFKESEQDKQREQKLLVELPGILNWSVTGLQNLLQRTHFLIPPSSLSELEGYRVNSDPVRQFADELLQPSTNKTDWAASGELYNAYKEWSQTNGYRTLASNQFAERLSSIGFKKTRSSSGRYWEAKYLRFSMSGCSSLPSGISPHASKYSV